MCCPDMERMSNTWVPFYFTDKHQGSNGFFEREMAHSISHPGIVGHGHSQKLQLRKFYSRRRSLHGGVGLVW